MSLGRPWLSPEFAPNDTRPLAESDTGWPGARPTGTDMSQPGVAAAHGGRGRDRWRAPKRVPGEGHHGNAPRGSRRRSDPSDRDGERTHRRAVLLSAHPAFATSNLSIRVDPTYPGAQHRPSPAPGSLPQVTVRAATSARSCWLTAPACPWRRSLRQRLRRGRRRCDHPLQVPDHGYLQAGGDFTKIGDPNALSQATTSQQGYAQFSPAP